LKECTLSCGHDILEMQAEAAQLWRADTDIVQGQSVRWLRTHEHLHAHMLSCCAAAVDGTGKPVLLLFAPAGTSSKNYTLKLRDDGKAALQDGEGKCIVAWDTGPGIPAGC
jgi:hypothetical protein